MIIFTSLILLAQASLFDTFNSTTDSTANSVGNFVGNLFGNSNSETTATSDGSSGSAESTKQTKYDSLAESIANSVGDVGGDVVEDLTSEKYQCSYVISAYEKMGASFAGLDKSSHDGCCEMSGVECYYSKESPAVITSM